MYTLYILLHNLLFTLRESLMEPKPHHSYVPLGSCLSPALHFPHVLNENIKNNNYYFMGYWED